MITKKGRVALITGAAASIGQAFAKRLAEDGADIVVADIADGSETVALVESVGSRAISVPCDVASPEQVHDAVRAAEDAFGKVDILVHNAGIYPMQDFEDIDFAAWRRVMSINLDSCFHLCHEIVPGMRARRYGRILLISSNSFHAGAGGITHYVASKGGVIGFARSLASELGDEGITVNTVAPTLTRTNGTTTGVHEELGLFKSVPQLQSIKRLGEPEDLVGAISFLTSDDSAFITGQTLPVDGGWAHA